MKEIKIKIIGSGNGGAEIVNEIKKNGLPESELIAATTDPIWLVFHNADKKILLGKDYPGRFIGGNPVYHHGEQTKLSSKELENVIQGADIVIVTATLGDSTDSGVAPEVAKISKNLGILTVSIVTIPLYKKESWESIYAFESLKKIIDNSHTVLPIFLDDIQSILPISILDGFLDAAINYIAQLIKIFVKAISSQELTETDFSKIKTIFFSGGISQIYSGEFWSLEKGMEEAILEAFSLSCTRWDITRAKGAFIIIVSDPSIKITDFQKTEEFIKESTNMDVKIIHKVIIDSEMMDKVRIYIIFTGIENYLIGLLEH